MNCAFNKPLRPTLFAAALLLGACSHSPLSNHWPVPPAIIANAFSPLDASIPAGARMSAIDAALGKLLATVAAEANHASERDWGSGDVVTAGGLMAVLGGMAAKVGLVNTGAAVGLVGGSGRARFQYSVQRQAYRKAESALACVQAQVQLLNDDSRVLVLSAGEAKEKQSASNAPALAIDAVNRARRRLINDLDAVGITAPTRQEIEALVAQVQKSASAPEPTASASAASALKDAKSAGSDRLSFAAKAASAPGFSAFSAPLRNWTEAARAPSPLASAPTEWEPSQAKWLVDDARNVANAYAAELAKCVL